jgi:outer membrane protein OmpA-like peptidoglycan-associated protein
LKNVIYFLLILACFQGKAQQKLVSEIYFDSGKESLSESSINVLNSLSKNVYTENNVIIHISGYCDSIGNENFNYDLSLKRAHAVESYFVGQKIKSESILIKGFGEANPKYSGKEWYKNRRVEISVSMQPKEKNLPIVKADSVIKPLVVKKTVISTFVDTAKVGGKLALKNINFFSGSATPLPEASKPMSELYLAMEENPSLEICIEGHICCTKYDPDNISTHRAEAVYNYLIKKGIDKNRLSYKGFGHSQPLNNERNEEEQQMNRRVEIRIVKK